MTKQLGFKIFCLEFEVSLSTVVCTEKAYNKSLIYSGTEALSKPSTGWGNLQGQETNSFNDAFVELPSRWDLNATTVESETAIEMQENCQTNNIRQITNTITNTKYQTANKCQTDDPRYLNSTRNTRRQN